eukprot:TRINITY_DN5855_c0_g1_i1.p1 TRINITY_DN5855_c0_g1~~TRINITY_DN5855_c0_g1_i1.p1  ORF type:complete len:258 (+),score=66.34 TRINITY_DN5855_c0_g1_i1:137-910(+)
MSVLGKYQRHVLVAGDGKSNKAFKGEWATVKDGELLIGSTGKEWVDDDGFTVLNRNAEWIKVISKASKSVTSVDWHENYMAIRRAANATAPGYVWHEAVAWDPVHRNWLLAPRKSTAEPYLEANEWRHGTNEFYIASEDFERVKKGQFGTFDREWGVSSLKILPFSLDMEREVSGYSEGRRVGMWRQALNRERYQGTYGSTSLPGQLVVVVSVKESKDGEMATRIGVFDWMNGAVKMDWVDVPTHLKYEGVEIVKWE